MAGTLPTTFTAIVHIHYVPTQLNLLNCNSRWVPSRPQAVFNSSPCPAFGGPRMGVWAAGRDHGRPGWEGGSGTQAWQMVPTQSDGSRALIANHCNGRGAWRVQTGTADSFRRCAQNGRPITTATLWLRVAISAGISTPWLLSLAYLHRFGHKPSLLPQDGTATRQITACACPHPLG